MAKYTLDKDAPQHLYGMSEAELAAHYASVYGDLATKKGGPGSGFYGHSGRPGKRGGSAPAKGGMSAGVADRVGHPGTGIMDAAGGLTIDKMRELSRVKPLFRTRHACQLLDALPVDERLERMYQDGLPRLSDADRLSDPTIDESNRWYWSTLSTRAITKHEIVDALSGDTGINTETIDRTIHEWAKDANQTSAAMEIQMAISEAFGVPLSDYQSEVSKRVLNTEYVYNALRRSSVAASAVEYAMKIDFAGDEAKENPDLFRKFAIAQLQGYFENDGRISDRTAEMIVNAAENGQRTNDPSGARKIINELLATGPGRHAQVVEAMYQRTQRAFQAAGYGPDDEIVVYRGYNDPAITVRGKWLGRTMGYVGNAAESWTLSPHLARDFGNVIFAMRVPIRSILCTARTGFGCLREGEVVVIGNSRPGTRATVVSSVPFNESGYSPTVFFRDVATLVTTKGGPGSGNFGHAGRPGKVGGSAPHEGASAGVSIRPGKAVELADSDRQPVDMDADAYLYVDANTPWRNASDATRAKVKDEIARALSERTGVDYETVNALIGAWAHSTRYFETIELQEAAAEEFGLTLSDFHQKKLEDYRQREREDREKHDLEYPAYVKWGIESATEHPHSFYIDSSGHLHNCDPLQPVPKGGLSLAEADVSPEKLRTLVEDMFAYSPSYRPIADRQTERKVLRAMYEYTQERLAQAGFPPYVTLYRGLDLGDEVARGTQCAYRGNTIESWTVDTTVADDFGYNVVAMRVPRSSILSSCRTGFGCLTEGEFVILDHIKGARCTVVE